MDEHPGDHRRVDGVVAVGRLAALLAGMGEAGLADGLRLLVEGLGLRSAVLREVVPGACGELRAVAGEVVRPVRVAAGRALGLAAATVELPVSCGGRELATLTVVGARPSQLPTLRSAADVLALALGRDPDALPPALPQELLTGAAAELDRWADQLHDGPVQDLVVARYAADAAVRGGDPGLARDAVQAALVGLRRMLWQLRPRGGDGLEAAVLALAERMAESGGPELVCAADPAVRLGGAAGELAYRIVQAVVERVADADLPAVHVLIRPEGDQAVVEVSAPLLPGTEPWTFAVLALGGTLSATGTRLRLALPGHAQPTPSSLTRPQSERSGADPAVRAEPSLRADPSTRASRPKATP